MYPASDYILQSMPQSGGFVIPQGSMVGGMVRPGQIMTPPGNQGIICSNYLFIKYLLSVCLRIEQEKVC